MGQRFLMAWAAVATLVAVGMTGYVVGKNAERRGADRAQARPVSDMAFSTAPGDASEPVVKFAMPAEFANAPREWRTQETEDFSGYVALFDPNAREIIVEQCRHAGYPIDASGHVGQPIEQEFCTPVLSGWLATLTQDKALVQDRRRGSTVAVKLSASLDSEIPGLRLVFDQHDVRLVPGSKNDLLQAIERDPQMAQQKRRYLIALSGGSRPRSDQADADDRND